VDRIYQRNTIFGADIRNQLECIPTKTSARKGHRTYVLKNVPQDFYSQHWEEIEKGELVIGISNVRLYSNNDTISFTDSSRVNVTSRRTTSIRKMISNGDDDTIKTWTILAFVISASDVRNSDTAETIYPYLFGEGVTLQTQYESCSGERLLVEPSFGGVVDIQLSATADSYNPRSAAFEAMDIFEEQMKIDNIEDMVDSIMFCLPPGIANFAASAVTNNYRSIYGDKNCARISISMHEIAHNMGLSHASKEGRSYGDTTGYMGKSEKLLGGPQKCFNPAQHWQLGWYEDLRLDWKDGFTTPSLVRLGSFVDYKTLKGSQDTFVLINLADKLFLQLNLAKSYNVGTGDMIDKVTVVEQDNSNLLAGLDDSQNSILEIGNFDETGKTLVIQVCMIVLHGDATDAAYISIGLEGSKCKSQTNSNPNISASSSTRADAAKQLKKGRNSDNFRI
jgi:hypothetical protein